MRRSLNQKRFPLTIPLIKHGKFLFLLMILLWTRPSHSSRAALFSLAVARDTNMRVRNHLSPPILKNSRRHNFNRGYGSRCTSCPLKLSHIETSQNAIIRLHPITTNICNLFQSFSIPHQCTQNPSLILIYVFLANIIYLLRRSHLRNMSKRTLLKIRLTRENGVSFPLYFTNLLVWQLFVIAIFPLLEPLSRVFGYVSFYYFYPNASGVGIIFEPLSAQNLPMSKRAKSQIRCDWHKFSVNVGSVGRDGYRHPPSVERNLPHLDVPMWGWKHWPWSRRLSVDQGGRINSVRCQRRNKGE